MPLLSAAGGQHLWSEEDEGKRGGLFRGTTAGAGKTQAGAKPGVRTAEDIKAAYGRPSATKRCDPLRLLSALHCAVLAGVPLSMALSVRFCSAERSRQC